MEDKNEYSHKWLKGMNVSAMFVNVMRYTLVEIPVDVLQSLRPKQKKSNSNESYFFILNVVIRNLPLVRLGLFGKYLWPVIFFLLSETTSPLLHLDATQQD